MFSDASLELLDQIDEKVARKMAGEPVEIFDDDEQVASGSDVSLDMPRVLLE